MKAPLSSSVTPASSVETAAFDGTEGLLLIFVAMVKTAIIDYETLPHNCRNYRTAAAFLAGTRLMGADGRIDRHGYAPPPVHVRRRRTP